MIYVCNLLFFSSIFCLFLKGFKDMEDGPLFFRNQIPRDARPEDLMSRLNATTISSESYPNDSISPSPDEGIEEEKVSQFFFSFVRHF